VSAVQGYFVLAATARSVIPKGSAAHETRLMAEGLLRPAHRLPGREAHP
jgi:TetR/AcrR family transcriptional repressor of bet genes